MSTTTYDLEIRVYQSAGQVGTCEFTGKPLYAGYIKDLHTGEVTEGTYTQTDIDEFIADDEYGITEYRSDISIE